MELCLPLYSSDILQVILMRNLRFIQNLLKQLKTKEEGAKILETIYGEGSDLEKIFALEALSDYYETNPNFALTKFKHLSVINSWRINIKICSLSKKLGDKLSKSHFKLIFEPMFLKFMTSP
jgi:hypothetical protein